MILKYHAEIGEYVDGGVGNFIELLNYRVRGGDTNQGEHLKNCGKNASYVSKTIQNELISCCGDKILEQVFSEEKVNSFQFWLMKHQMLQIRSKCL